jgi:hypothetical protein
MKNKAGGRQGTMKKSVCMRHARASRGQTDCSKIGKRFEDAGPAGFGMVPVVGVVTITVSHDVVALSAIRCESMPREIGTLDVRYRAGADAVPGPCADQRRAHQRFDLVDHHVMPSNALSLNMRPAPQMANVLNHLLGILTCLDSHRASQLFRALPALPQVRGDHEEPSIHTGVCNQERIGDQILGCNFCWTGRHDAQQPRTSTSNSFICNLVFIRAAQLHGLPAP